MILKLLFATAILGLVTIGLPVVERIEAKFTGDMLSESIEAKLAGSAAMDAAYRQVHDLGHFLANSGYYDVTFLLSGR
jgi:hypothetical protein